VLISQHQLARGFLRQPVMVIAPNFIVYNSNPVFCPFPQYVSGDLFSLRGKKNPTVLIIVILDIISVDDNKTG